ncbi:MAG: T9SS type A sorting domain-containing protein [Bacteroidales bacterium]|jgi:hypothetical protein|nr:T9SS type A sorting domain-containing protein [Bacteroidales bacterium]
MKKKLFFLTFIIGLLVNLTAQQTINGTIFPDSWKQLSQKDLSTVTLTPLTTDQISNYIIESGKDGKPYQIGHVLPVAITPSNSGQWDLLADGRKVWRIQMTSEGAQGAILYFDHFRLSKGATLFVYSADHQSYIGPFNQQDNLNNAEYAIGPIAGDQIIVEYVVPKNVESSEDFLISGFSYIFRDLGIYEDTKVGACEVNVNCPEGDNWKSQSNGVARITVKQSGETYLCSGSMINNTSNDGTPYFLTAYHCGDGCTASDFNQWVFTFHYQYPGCSNSGAATGAKSFTGCTKKAEGNVDGGSDFFLLLLNTTSTAILDAGIEYNGWDRNTNGSPNGVSIHHPDGARKKISTYTQTLISGSFNWGATNAHWRVRWAATISGHGVTEGGSSGSPIFNNNGLIVGTLSGGSSDCDNVNAYDLYGKFSYHWLSNGSANSARLKPWLDPTNTDAMSCSNYSTSAISKKPTLQNNSFTVYPVPAKNNMMITFDHKIADKIEIYNILGVKIKELTHLSIANDLDISDFNSGTYFVKALLDNTVSVKKFVVVKE